MGFPTRKIGQTEVAAIGFGLMGLGGVGYGSAGTNEERFEVLDYAVKRGATNWDTSDVYGDSEVLIGAWFKKSGKRNEIFLATKFGITFDMATYTMGARGDAEYVKQCFDSSLEKLGVDSVDLYYYHRIDKNTPIETTIKAMAELVAGGKVKYLGLSECSAATLRRAHAVHPIAALQVEFSPFDLDIESPKINLLKTARELGVAIVAYSPLGRGILTGTLDTPSALAADDFRKTLPWYNDENLPKITSWVERIKVIGAKHNATPGQISLAWVLSNGADFIPIPGTKKVKYLEENLKAIDIKLTAEEIMTIRGIAEEAQAVIDGSRYAASMADLAFLDTVEL